MTTNEGLPMTHTEQGGVAYVHQLKCVKEIEACPNLAVGDILWKVAYEILPGGYEYAVLRRDSDRVVVKVRVDHLEECFEVIDVPVESDIYKISELMEAEKSGDVSKVTTHHIRRYL